MRAPTIAFLSVAALAACDTRAQPSSASAGAVDPDRVSAEHESCGTTLHCAEGLRCFDHACRRTDRSLMGDYHAALGARAKEAGDLKGAVAAYGEALKHYGIEKLSVPIELECAYGAVLADSRDDKELAELAARVLHRCIAGAPSGSAMRQKGLYLISALQESGLDPAHLLRDEPADVYLSGAPARPRTDDLKVEVSASPAPSARSWPGTVEAIKAARPALVACWEKQKENALSVAVPMSSVYKDSGYDDEPSYYVTGIDPKAAPPANEVEQCVRDAIAPAVKGVKGGGSWAATVTVTVQ